MREKGASVLACFAFEQLQLRDEHFFIELVLGIDRLSIKSKFVTDSKRDILYYFTWGRLEKHVFYLD